MEISEENELEKLLRLAAEEPANRPGFSSGLLASTVYILASAGTTTDQEEQISLEAGSNISIQNWEKKDGSPVIPFFTSLEVLQNSIETEESYLALPATTLFEITNGSYLVLNPKSDYGKEFFPDEIQHLLSSGLGKVPEQRTMEKETRVLLAQPSEYPSKMIDSLTQLFSKHKNVEKAYLALMHDPSIDEKPHLVVGIEADGDFERVIREAGNVAGDTVPDGEFIDLYRVDPNDNGLSQYFINETKPFYERKWGSKLSSIIGIGKA